MISAFRAIGLIIVNSNLMEILMGNVYARMVITKIIKINYVNNVLSFGIKIINIFLIYNKLNKLFCFKYHLLE